MKSLVLCLMCLVSSGWAAEEAIEVMSFNIRYINSHDGANQWKHRKEVVVKQIRQIDPDLLGCQEMLAAQRDVLRKGLPDYGFVGVGRDDGKEKGEMAALFFRNSRFELLDSGHFWLSETPNKVGSRGWDARIPRMATWVRIREKQVPDATPIFFLNAHFDHRGAEARRRSAELIVQQIKMLGKDCRIVVTGDFNAAERSAPYQALFDPAQSGLIDTYRRVVTTATPNEGTFNGFKGETRGPRIDWIACSDHFGVADASILRKKIEDRWPSDHFAISARLIGL